jgi:hypothetical protein
MSYYQPQYGAGMFDVHFEPRRYCKEIDSAVLASLVGGQGFSSQAQSLYNAYDQQYGTPQQPSYDSRSSGGPMRSTGDYSSSYRDQPYSRGPSHAHEEFKTLFMGNLPPTVTEQALEQFFSDAGRVIAVRLKRYHDTGKVKGYVVDCFFFRWRTPDIFAKLLRWFASCLPFLCRAPQLTRFASDMDLSNLMDLLPQREHFKLRTTVS